MRRRYLLIAGLTAIVLGLVIAVQPLASAHGTWRWWLRPQKPTFQPANKPKALPPARPPVVKKSPSPSPSPSRPSSPATPKADPHAGHATGEGLPTYSAARIPSGVAGASAFRVQRTGEMPGPDPQGIGAFRTVCEYSHMLADDPIVKPGQPGASHLHTFWGNTRANGNSTAESLMNSGNGTCRGGTANRSAYWTPSVIDTRTDTPLAPELIHVYYKSGYAGIRPDQITTLPPGLRMVVGNAMADGPQDGQDWSCWNGGGQGATIPRCGVGDFISMNVNFPQCWDGRLDAPDHKSHLAWPANGRCPASHSRAIPAITYHVLYRVTPGLDPSALRLASDKYDESKPGGYSVHGDWFGGWDRGVLDTWTRLCVQRAATSCGSHMLGDGRVIS